MSPPVSDTELAAVLANLGGPSLHDSAVAALAGLQPEAVCRVCMLALPDRDVDLGTHTGCAETPDLGPEPPPTIDALSAALIDYESSSARSMQAAVGPSEIGTPCNRRLGYALRNIAKQPGTGAVKWAPMLGTAAHVMNAEALTLANQRAGRQRWLIEQRVTAERGLDGNTDAYDSDYDIVCDWKLVGQSTVDKARKHGPGQQYEWQAHLYGRGWQRLGRDPKWVRIVFLPRWSSKITDGFEWTAPYSRAIADLALDRLARVSRQLDALDVDNHPDRWAQLAEPETASACFFCDYRRPSNAPANANGCPGVRSKADKSVADYLDELPLAVAP